MQGKREGERIVRCFVNMGNLGSNLGEGIEGVGKEKGKGEEKEEWKLETFLKSFCETGSFKEGRKCFI